WCSWTSRKSTSAGSRRSIAECPVAAVWELSLLCRHRRLLSLNLRECFAFLCRYFFLFYRWQTRQKSIQNSIAGFDAQSHSRRDGRRRREYQNARKREVSSGGHGRTRTIGRDAQ